MLGKLMHTKSARGKLMPASSLITTSRRQTHDTSICALFADNRITAIGQGQAALLVDARQAAIVDQRQQSIVFDQRAREMDCLMHLGVDLSPKEINISQSQLIQLNTDLQVNNVDIVLSDRKRLAVQLQQLLQDNRTIDIYPDGGDGGSGRRSGDGGGGGGGGGGRGGGGGNSSTSGGPALVAGMPTIINAGARGGERGGGGGGKNSSSSSGDPPRPSALTAVPKTKHESES